MAVLCDEIKSDDFVCPYGAGAGYLRVWKNSWNSCRVEFHHRYDNLLLVDREKFEKLFFFKEHSPIQQALDVITEVEEKLKVNSTEHLKVYSANKPGVYCIDAGNWWLDPFRFTLLTCLLRDAKKDLKTTLTSEGRYLISTPFANEHFFDGNIFYQKEFYRGWVREFEGKNGEEMKTYLSDKPSSQQRLIIEHHQSFPSNVHTLKKAA